ncbi:MAG: cyclic nucleotide-binding domain-containing protein [Chloroflexota bacterium]
MINKSTLMRYPFFANLDEDFIQQMLPIGEEIILAEEEWLFRQDQPAKKIYLITEGKVALTIRFRENEIDRLNPYLSGEIIGWSALVKPKIYTMGAIAELPSKLIGFNGEKLSKLMDQEKSQGYIMLKNLNEIISERLINRNIQLMSLRS